MDRWRWTIWIFEHNGQRVVTIWRLSLRLRNTNLCFVHLQMRSHCCPPLLVGTLNPSKPTSSSSALLQQVPFWTHLPSVLSSPSLVPVLVLLQGRLVLRVGCYDFFPSPIASPPMLRLFPVLSSSLHWR